MEDTIQTITQKIIAFRDQRNWQQFHNPKDLAISISLEAAELLEVFQWTGADTQADTKEKMDKIKEELADVLIYSLMMAHDLDLDVLQIIQDKLAVNEKKYPVEQAYGKSLKYTAYQGVQK